MAQVKWLKAKSGTFNTAANWSRAVPGAGDNAVLGDISGKDYTVTLGAGSVTVGSLEIDKTATLDITAGSVFATDETGIHNAGAIEIGALGGVFGFGGTLNATGRISISGGTLEADQTNGVLDGGGFVYLAGGSLAGASAGLTLTDTDNPILGAGSVNISQVDFVNDRLITSQKGKSLGLTVAAGATLTNDGRIWGRGSTGGMTLNGAVVNDDILVVRSSTLTVSGVVTGTGMVRIMEGVMDFQSSFNETVRFHALTPGGELILADSQDYAARIYGFAPGSGDELDLKDIGFAGADEATYGKGMLTVTDGTHTAEIRLIGHYEGVTFTAASDGSGGTLITASTTTAASALASAMAAMAPSSVAENHPSTTASPTASILAHPG